MKKRKGLSSDERDGVDADGVMKTKKGKIRKRKVVVVTNGGLDEDGIETKSELTMKDGADPDVSAKVRSKVKRKRGDGAAEDVTATSKSKPKRKRADGSEQEEAAKAKRKLKRKRKSRRELVIEDIDEDVSEESREEGNVDEEDDVEKPSGLSATAAKYVPHHLRQVEKGSEERIRLERRVRGACLFTSTSPTRLCLFDGTLPPL